MKKLLSLLVVGTVVMSASVVSAGEYSLFGFGQRATQPVSTAPAAFGPAPSVGISSANRLIRRDSRRPQPGGPAGFKPLTSI